MATGRKRNEVDEIAEALGIRRRPAKRPRKGGPSCRDCFFHRNLLCALDLEGPCSTFRPDSPQGLVPPLQPSLLPRRRLDEQLAEPPSGADMIAAAHGGPH